MTLAYLFKFLAFLVVIVGPAAGCYFAYHRHAIGLFCKERYEADPRPRVVKLGLFFLIALAYMAGWVCSLQYLTGWVW